MSGKSSSARTSRRAASKPAASQDVRDTPLQRAGRVATLVKLDDVRFASFSATMLEDRPNTPPSDVVPKFAFTRPRVARQNDRISVSSTFVFSMLTKDATTAEATTIATLRATIHIAYLPKDDAAISDEDLREFANVNVPFNAWGYWREFVHSSLARLQLPPQTLPLFRVHTAHEMMIEDTA